MQNPLGPIEIVCWNATWQEPAIDFSGSDAPEGASEDEKQKLSQEMFGAYLRTRNLKNLRLKQDVAPTLFLLRPLKYRTVATTLDCIIGEDKDARRFLLAFQMSLESVKIPGTTDPLTWKTSQVRDDGAVLPVNQDAKLEDIASRFGLDTVYEIGAVAYQRTRVGAPDRVPFSYPAGLILMR